jgi:hypothetical protein
MEKSMNQRKRCFLGIDQYGTRYDGLQHPRKDLKARLGGKINKMYVDNTDGSTSHVGYVVGGLWVQLFEYFNKPVHTGKNDG